MSRDCYVDNDGCTVCPAVVGVPGAPAHVVDVPVLGWSAGANSRKRSAGMRVRTRFTVGSCVGIVVGFAATPRRNVTMPENIGWGWYLHVVNGLLLAQAVEFGVAVGPLVARVRADEFEVRRDNTAVYYIQNDTLVHRSIQPINGRICVASALYASGDEVV